MKNLDVVREHLRLVILRGLNELPGYESNESLLHHLASDYGIPASRAQVRGELAWLAEQGLVTTREIADLVIATLTEQGQSVATGRSIWPGVKRPGPRG